jgi:GTP cyclohydrolase I
MRGIESRNSHVTTSAVRGVFKDNSEAKDEFLNFIE